MSKKEKKLQEQQKETTAPTAKQTKVKKAMRARWLFRLIIVLLAGALIFGIYYNLKSNQDTMRAKTNRPKSTFVAPRPSQVIPIKPEVIDIEVEPDLSDLDPFAKKETTTLDDKTSSAPALPLAAGDVSNRPASAITGTMDASGTGVDDTSLATQDAEETSSIIVAPEEHAEIVVVKPATNRLVTDITIEADAPQNTPSDENKTAVPYPGYDPSKPHFTAADALELRDNFLSEEACGDDLRKLILSDNQSAAAQNVIKDTSYFCLGTTNVHKELKSLFLKSKKEALIRYYKEHDPRWKYRLKKAYVSLITTRNLNPTGSSVPDLLDRAHNALVEKNMTLTIDTLSKLPDNIRPVFTEFMQKTNNFVKAKMALDALILSYAKGE